MNNNEKKRTKSIYELYGISKFGINPKKFSQLDGNLNDQIKGSMDLIFFNKLIPQNYGDYLVSFTIITIFFIIFSRQYVVNFFETARSDWENYKCDPRIMPYSGYVKKNENSTEFISTGDNFNECIEPISRYMAEMQFGSFSSVVNMDLSNLIDSINQSASLIQGSLNQLKDLIGNILSLISLEENKKNKESGKVNNQIMGSMLLTNAMFRTISDLVIGTNKSVEAVLTYVYGFFEGALVLLTIFVVGFTVLGGGIQMLALYLGVTAVILITNPFTAAASPPVMASVPIMTAIAFTFYTLAFAFFIIFIVIVVTMLMYAEFLKAVFNIDVQARKSPFPNSPL